MEIEKFYEYISLEIHVCLEGGEFKYHTSGLFILIIRLSLEGFKLQN